MRCLWHACRLATIQFMRFDALLMAIDFKVTMHTQSSLPRSSGALQQNFNQAVETSSAPAPHFYSRTFFIIMICRKLIKYVQFSTFVRMRSERIFSNSHQPSRVFEWAFASLHFLSDFQFYHHPNIMRTLSRFNLRRHLQLTPHYSFATCRDKA